jgi:hypothetical protein
MSSSMEGIIFWVKKFSGTLCERWSLMLFCRGVQAVITGGYLQ